MEIITHTQWDIDNRPRNISQMMNDDEWYSFTNALGDHNDVTEESWTLIEILKMADTNGYGPLFVTTHCVQTVMDNLAFQYNHNI